jgi:hypothetical protein
MALIVMLTVLLGAQAHGDNSRNALKGSAELLRGRVQECTAAEVRKLNKSGEGAAILADAALTICRNAVEDAVEGGVRLRRVELRRGMSPAEERQYRTALGRTLRDAVVSDAVAVRASDERRREEATHSVAQLAAQPIENLKKAVSKCLDVFAARMDREGDDAIEPVTEMCRPEIEALARGAFLADNSIGLAKARDEALTFAIQTAAKRFGGKVM